MTPDKIYINPRPNPSDGYVGIAWDKPIPKCETYIRKDALLEWAKEWSDRYPYSHEFQMIIDKIESL